LAYLPEQRTASIVFAILSLLPGALFVFLLNGKHWARVLLIGFCGIFAVLGFLLIFQLKHAGEIFLVLCLSLAAARAVKALMSDSITAFCDFCDMRGAHFEKPKSFLKLGE
jgi:hypothetical protein